MSSTPQPSLRLAPWLLGGAIAVLVLLCAWLARLCLQLRTENTLLRQQQALTALELRATRNQLEAERILAAREHADLAKKPGTKSSDTAPPPR